MARKAYRETCLCRSCFNLRCYREALQVLAKILVVLVKASSREDAEGDAEDAEGGAAEGSDEADKPEPPDPAVVKLLDFCQSCYSGRRRRITELVCADQLEDVASDCLKGLCNCCGFAQIWSKGLRPKLVDAYGKLRPGISRAWLTPMQWECLKTGGDGSSSEDDLRQSCEGTPIEFLDRFEPVQKGAVGHCFHIDHDKAASQELHENATPGMAFDDSDWSENGSIQPPKQLQQEYWKIIYYSLLVSMVKFLLARFWKDRTSALPKDAEVTVEPSERPANETHEQAITRMEGSYFAIVAAASQEGATTVVTVRLANSEERQVPRSRLRHRKWHRIAFLQITPETRHDAITSQAFHDRRHQFFQILNDKGREAALAFARDDRAEAKRKTDEATITAATAAVVATADPTDPTVAAAAAAAAACRRHIKVASLPRPKAGRRVPSDAEFQAWLMALDEEQFWAWVEHSDNATHFKSKENLYYWSQRMDKVEFIKLVWVEFGCPGHGTATLGLER